MRKRQIQQDSSGDERSTILVVDDEPMVLRVCRRVLERDGHRVLTTQEADGAIEMVRDCGERIDVLLCDVVMPRICGGELATELRALAPSLEVIFFSGHLGDAEARCQIESGHAKFLRKPFVAEELRRMIDDVLATV